MPLVEIRHARVEDVPTILTLIQALAEYEREPDAVVATEDDLRRDGFGETPSFHVLLAEQGSEVIGFAFYFFTYSTWQGRRCLYVEDLFVPVEHRKKGAGVLLMKELAVIAMNAQCKRMVWQVLDWNEPAIVFYERLGARIRREWLSVRVEGHALEALATR